MAGKIRLDKYLTEMQAGTRSQIKEMAKKGCITVNGSVITKTDSKIDPDTDRVALNGQEIRYTKYEYYLLHKPQGVVCAVRDNLHRTVMELLPDTVRRDLFPVGRLDIDTEGLLLITNDGDLSHQLLSPKKHVDKVYYAKVTGQLPPDARRQIADGIVLKDGTKTLPAGLEILTSDGETSEIQLTIHEGKFHQVKRMFEAMDCNVTYLKRLSMGSLTLDGGLAVGECRPLTPDEIKRIKER